MNENRGILRNGLGMVTRNKRYILWFWILSLLLAAFGTVGFQKSASAILDRSLYSQGLTRGFDVGVFVDLLMRPDFPRFSSIMPPALYFACLFLFATALFLPGVFAGYASTYRLPREDFFRACGRNLWRFIRIMIIAGIVMSILAGLLFWANGAIVEKAGESTNEKLPFDLQMIGLAVIFLIMTTLRIWFDLAEVDAVLNDQRAVRKSISSAFKYTFRSLGRLLASYVTSTIVAAILLVGGLWIWMKIVSPQSVFGAFVVAQIMLFLLLIPRFWQRGIAVSYWQQRMLVPVVAVQSIETTPVTVAPEPVIPAPEPSPVITNPITPPAEPQL
jgi:hypothetical protein